MSPEKEERLVKQFPELFRDYGKPPTESCLAFGCEHGDGWFTLLNRVCEKLEKVRNSSGLDLYFQQIKEKWGLLCIYMSFYTDEVENILEQAEKESSCICEWCGAPGELHTHGWCRTLCPSCNEDWLKGNRGDKK